MGRAAKGISDVLFERPPLMKVFISSQMVTGVLDAERVAAAEAVESTSIATAWYWERDARAGPYSSEAVCIGHARSSDGLVLLLAEELRPMVRREYTAAFDQGAPCYILVKEVAAREADADEFVSQERDGPAVTRPFRSISELKTEVTGAIVEFAVQSSRREIVRRRTAQARRRGPLSLLGRAIRRGGSAQ